MGVAEARLAVVSMYLCCCVTHNCYSCHGYPIHAPKYQNGLADDRGLLTSSHIISLAVQCLFHSECLLVDTDMQYEGFLTSCPLLFIYPCTLSSGLFILDSSVFILQVPNPPTQPLATAHKFTYILTSGLFFSHVCPPKTLPIGGFPLIAVFQGQPSVTCNGAQVRFQFATTYRAYPSMNQAHTVSFSIRVPLPK